jgi:signal transduction histidine kinase
MRAVWIVLAVISVFLFVAAIPFSFAARQVVCRPGTLCAEGHLSSETAHALPEIGLTLGNYAAYVITLDSLLALGFVAIGTFVFWRKSNEGMALGVAIALVLFGTTWPLVPALLEDAPGALRSLVLVWKPLGFAALLLVAYLFPDGRFVPHWTRWPALVGVSWQLVAIFATGTPLDSSTWPVVLRAPFEISVFGFPVFSQVYRYVRISNPVQRQQTKWVVFGLALTILGGVLFLLLGALLPEIDQPGRGQLLFDLTGRTVFGSLALLLIPSAIGIATLRYRLWDLDPILNRSLVYGSLTACVVGIYVLVVGYLGTAFRTGGNLLVSLVAAGLTAILFQPLRERLQRVINRLMYGERDEPYAVLSRLGQRLEGSLAPAAVPSAIVETIAQALKIPYVALTLKQGDAFTFAATHGTSVDNPLHLPLVYQGEVVGALLLGSRSPGESFSTADRRLLEHIAQQAGVATQAVRLTADLQRSRERLVTTREEELRRLRRDLHDGLGPTLGSLRLKLEIAHDLILTDPPAAAALVMKLQAEAEAAVTDVRNLSYQLRPPALDQLGLVEALRETAVGYEQSVSGRLCIRVSAPEWLPPLPAAVEVAAYRIAQEALTNVVRHAEAHVALVSVTLNQHADTLVDDTLIMEIVDDGRGLPDAQGGISRRTGVGLQSMRERADELGGKCIIETRLVGGTRVYASLPYSALLLTSVPLGVHREHERKGVD